MTRWLLGLGVLVSVAACGSPEPSPTPRVTATPAPTSIATDTPAPSAAPTVPPSPVVAGFAAKSVTFVSQSTGFVLGTAPCASGSCLAVARTDDGGRTWSGVPAPAARYANNVTDSEGVHSIRFATADDGWIFGPELWSTHDGGAHWTKQSPLAGAGAVWALEAANGTAHAAVFDPSSPSIRLLTTGVTSDSWQAAATSLPVGSGPVPQVQIVLQGASGWADVVNRVVVGGARLGGGTWTAWTPPCSNDNGPLTLAGVSPTTLVALCNAGVYGASADSVGWHAKLSTDGGSSFANAWATVPAHCCFERFAAASTSTMVVASTAGGIIATFDGGHTWATVSTVAVDTDMGFTTPSQGVAVDDQSGTLVMTYDGGHTWVKAAI